MDAGADVDPWSWYTDIAPVTRAYLTATFAVTTLATLDLVSPFSLYYNSNLIMQGQVWRLVTNFLYFGPLGINFFMHMYFAVQQCGWLERDFHGPGGTADFLFFLLLSAAALLAAAPFVSIAFFGSALTLVVVYVWSKKHADVMMGLFGVIPFRGAWLPYVLVIFSLMFGQDIQGDILGIVVGHLYFYCAEVWPSLAASRGWRWKRLVQTPRLLYWLMGSLQDVEAREARLQADEEARQRRLREEAEAGAGGQAPAQPPAPAGPGEASGRDQHTTGAYLGSEGGGTRPQAGPGDEDEELVAALAAIAEMESRELEQSRQGATVGAEPQQERRASPGGEEATLPRGDAYEGATAQAAASIAPAADTTPTAVSGAVPSQAGPEEDTRDELSGVTAPSPPADGEAALEQAGGAERQGAEDTEAAPALSRDEVRRRRMAMLER